MMDLAQTGKAETAASADIPGATSMYPSYRSFDDVVDVERLRSLDSYLRRRIERHIAMGRESLFLNQHCLEPDAPYQPGVREVWLSRTKAGTPYNYLDIDRTELWEPTPEAAEFTLLMDFVATLPFESTGRILLIYDDGGRTVPAHRDHESPEICHDFIWMRTNLKKPFYVLNQFTGERQHVEGHTAWFDTVNQYHGSDAGEGLTFSIRVDGHFTKELKQRIPYCTENPASTPSVWAAMERGVH